MAVQIVSFDLALRGLFASRDVLCWRSGHGSWIESFRLERCAKYAIHQNTPDWIKDQSLVPVPQMTGGRAMLTTHSVSETRAVVSLSCTRPGHPNIALGSHARGKFALRLLRTANKTPV